MTTRPQHDFSGRVAFVTGAGSGMGLAAARAFAYGGAAVVLVDRDADAVLRAAAPLPPGLPLTLLHTRCDVTGRPLPPPRGQSVGMRVVPPRAQQSGGLLLGPPIAGEPRESGALGVLERREAVGRRGLAHPRCVGTTFPAMREADLAARLRIPVILATLLVIPAVVIEATPSSPELRQSAQVLNWVIWLVFLSEIVCLLAVTDDRRRWVRSHPLELAIVVITVPFLPASLHAGAVFRIARLVRLVLLLRLAQRLLAPSGLAYAAFVAAIAALAGGAAFEAAERGQDPAPTLWDGLWWAVTTITTVGYGDLSPQSVLGRVVGIALMVIGIGFAALLTGAIATRFLEAAADHDGTQAAAERQLADELRRLSDRIERLEARLPAEREAAAGAPGATVAERR